MPKKIVSKNVMEDLEDEKIETDVIEKQDKPVVEKKKKVMSEKQLEALKKGRQLGVEKLKQKGELTRAKQEEFKEIKKIKEEEKIHEIDDLKKINDLNYIRKVAENLHNKISLLDNVNYKFDNFLKEKEERRKLKDSKAIEHTVKQELPKAVNSLYLQQKLQNEMRNNPWLGRV